jgi:hypothetical protein
VGRSAGQVKGNVDKNGSDFTWYDIYVKQKFPFVVSTMFSGGISETQVLCVGANQIQGAGRVPPEKSAASLEWRSSSWMAMAIAIFSVIFTMV